MQLSIFMFTSDALLPGFPDSVTENFAVLNRGRHLYLAERPSRWAFVHILVYVTSDALLTGFPDSLTDVRIVNDLLTLF